MKSRSIQFEENNIREILTADNWCLFLCEFFKSSRFIEQFLSAMGHERKTYKYTIQNYILMLENSNSEGTTV